MLGWSVGVSGVYVGEERMNGDEEQVWERPRV